VRIQIDGFRAIDGEVMFIGMTPRRDSYEPLVGYPVLELARAVVDMVTHRLVARSPSSRRASPGRWAPGEHGLPDLITLRPG